MDMVIIITNHLFSNTKIKVLFSMPIQQEINEYQLRLFFLNDERIIIEAFSAFKTLWWYYSLNEVLWVSEYHNE